MQKHDFNVKVSLHLEDNRCRTKCQDNLTFYFETVPVSKKLLWTGWKTEERPDEYHSSGRSWFDDLIFSGRTASAWLGCGPENREQGGGSALDFLHDEGLDDVALLDVLELLKGDAAFPHGMSHPAGTPLI